ncbi:MAG: WYL domain-containing protein [Oscillospiraceae bacterium]
MAKPSMQALKILTLMKFLFDFSDQDHTLTINDMISALNLHGLTCERKSIYDYLESLRTFGMDIITVKNKTTGYYVASREFELAELKLLVDSVEASKFITHKKSTQLIKKLGALASTYESKLLSRQVHVNNRIKTMNESIYYNVDALHTAIATNKQISYQYCEYNLAKERKLRHNGKVYHVSPFALSWNDGNYYLAAYDELVGRINLYRVDKMSNIAIEMKPREGLKLYEKFDIAKYSSSLFSMFSGELRRVELISDNSLIGVFIDKFGTDIMIIAADENNFLTNVDISVSSQFFGWLAGFSGKIKIVSPASVKEEYKAYIMSILDEIK